MDVYGCLYNGIKWYKMRMRGLLVEWLEVVMIPWGLSVPPFTKVHKIGLSLHQLHQRLKGNTYWDTEMRKKSLKRSATGMFLPSSEPAQSLNGLSYPQMKTNHLYIIYLYQFVSFPVITGIMLSCSQWCLYGVPRVGKSWVGKSWAKHISHDFFVTPQR